MTLKRTKILKQPNIKVVIFFIVLLESSFNICPITWSNPVTFRINIFYFLQDNRKLPFILKDIVLFFQVISLVQNTSYFICENVKQQFSFYNITIISTFVCLVSE